ncbi:hypothetical protein [Kingella potus]|uniref:hypothetical protein n=1 Tax=Kingella potus TaxID=265175 RepID=UPI001FD2ACCF|nr:hypothetical protein [Kingella potus]UOP00376.1 hypothetical protein LVJ84_10850 [Kingella potus]
MLQTAACALAEKASSTASASPPVLWKRFFVFILLPCVICSVAFVGSGCFAASGGCRIQESDLLPYLFFQSAVEAV